MQYVDFKVACAIWSQNDKNVIFSDLQKPVPLSFLGSRYIQWKFEVIIAKNIEDVGLRSSPSREPRRSPSRMATMQFSAPTMEEALVMLTNLHHNSAPQAMFQVIKELYI